MSNFKIRAMMGASALIMAAGAAASASAQTAIYGGGSSLSAPYVRQAADCFGVQAPLFTPDKAAVNPPAEVFTGVNCATTQADPNAQIFLEASGSGAGIQAFFDHNPASLGTYTAVDGTTGQRRYLFPTMHYGTSDTPLSAASVAIYNGGGAVEPASNKTVNVVAPGVTFTPGTNFANPHDVYGPLIQVPLLITPVTVAFSPVYMEVYNSATPTTPTKYSFNITAPANKGSLFLSQATFCKIFNGQITNWNDPEIAQENGKKVTVKGTVVKAVTDAKTKAVTTIGYTTPSYTYYTPIVDPTDPAAVITPPAIITPATATTPPTFSAATSPWWTTGLPIELVGRSDGSGTTSIFTRALAAQCPTAAAVTDLRSTTTPQATFAAVTTPYAIDDSHGNIPSALSGNVGGPNIAGKYSLASGSGGVAAYLQIATPDATHTTTVAGRIGYLSPDYVTVPTAPAGVGNSKYGLTTAALQNSSGKYELPLAKTALAAFSGAGISPPTGANVGSPDLWVAGPSKLVSLANPAAATGYPITGTTNFMAYTCYADTTKNSDANVGYKLNRFLYWYTKNAIVTSTTAGSLGILESYGFAPVPAAWKTAIYNAFVAPSTATVTNPYYISPMSDLIQTTGTKTKIIFAHNSVCDSSGTAVARTGA